MANSGGLVLSFLADFPKHRLVRDARLYSSLRDIVDGDPFAGTFWPLTLELTHLGESDPSWNRRVMPGALRTLHDAKISIVDWEAPPKVFLDQSGDDGDNDSGPDYAIEDYGSDFGRRTRPKQMKTLPYLDPKLTWMSCCEPPAA